MNLAAVALAFGRCQENATRTAFLTEAGAVSHQAFQAMVASIAADLRGTGVRPGDKVLLRLGNSVEFAAAFLALVWVGAIPVLQNSRFGTFELAHIGHLAEPRFVLLAPGAAQADASHILDSDIRRLFVRADGLLDLDGTPVPRASMGLGESHEAGEDDQAFIVFTSGTTGRPKGIVHAHRWLQALGDSNRARIPPRPDDVVLATGEWSFISALGHNVLFALRNGVVASVLEDRASPQRILDTVARDRVTLLFSVATLYRRILGHAGIEQGYDLSSLRGVNSTGEPLGTSVQREWEHRFGCPVWEHYGLSEAQMVLGHGPTLPPRSGTVGRDWGAGVVVLDDDLRPVAPDTQGVLAFSARYPGFFLGYLGDEARTRQVFRGGWYVTSDLACQDADGYVRIIGRVDDCFKSKGVLIAPREVEDALLSLDDVVQACVFPIPDPEIGHRVGAAVVLRSRDDADDPSDSLRTALTGQIAGFKIPSVIVVLERLPTNVNGKIQRSEVVQGRS